MFDGHNKETGGTKKTWQKSKNRQKQSTCDIVGWELPA